MNSIHSKKLAFIVVDDDNEREHYKLSLERKDFEVELFDSEEAALCAVNPASPDIAIVHFGQNMSRTVDLIEQIHTLDSTVSIIYFTYYGAEELHEKAIKAGAYAVLKKPVSIYDAEFIELLNNAWKESKRKKRAFAGKRQALVLMPFAAEFDQVYLSIRKVFEERGYRCERMDELQYLGEVMNMLYEKLEESEFVIADITGNNPNVFYEMGYADALGRTVIILKHLSSKAPFDVQSRRLIQYDQPSQIEEDLAATIEALNQS